MHLGVAYISPGCFSITHLFTLKHDKNVSLGTLLRMVGPMLVGLTKCDEVLPALLGEAESAWPEASTLGGLQKGIPRC